MSNTNPILTDADLRAAAEADPDAMAEAKRLLASSSETQQWPMTIKLSVPVSFGKETVESLVFQKGNFGVLKGLSIDRAPNVDELMLIASRLCGKSLKVIELLDPDDADEVIAIAMGFFGRCRGAGKRLSQL